MEKRKSYTVRALELYITIFISVVVKDQSGFKKKTSQPVSIELHLIPKRWIAIFFLHISSLHVFIIYTNPGQQLKKTQLDVLFLILAESYFPLPLLCACVGIEIQRSIRFNQQVFQECTVGYIS